MNNLSSSDLSSNSWIKVPNFHHFKGQHCESTALQDHVNFLGFQLSEPMVFGLDATLGFGYWARFSQMQKNLNDDVDIGFLKTPGGKQNFFQENSLLCRILGIQIEKRDFLRPDQAWEDAVTIIKTGNPLLLQLDMAYLPYYNFSEEFHFGGHFVSMGGFNQEETAALIFDREWEDPQVVPREKLELARNSKGGWKMMWPHNVRYVLKTRSDGKRPPFAAGVKLALQQVVNQMLSPSISQQGIPGIKLMIKDIPSWQATFQNLPKQGTEKLLEIYRYIEEYGTGGGLFRKLYALFLQELSQNPELKTGPRAWTSQELEIIQQKGSLMELAAQKWTDFALMLKSAVDKYNENALQVLDYQGLQQLLEEISLIEEQCFIALRKIKL